MKIIFWGETAPFEITQNMYTMAALMARSCAGHPVHMFRFRGIRQDYYNLYREQAKLLREHSSHGTAGEALEFYDCGAKQDELVVRQMRQADLIVFNMPQQSRAWEQLLERHMMCFENAVYLLGSYQSHDVINRDFLACMYRIEKQDIGLIPYNNEFVHFTQQGRLTDFLARQQDKNEKNRLFMQELLRTSTLLLRHLNLA